MKSKEMKTGWQMQQNLSRKSMAVLPMMMIYILLLAEYTPQCFIRNNEQQKNILLRFSFTIQ